VTPSEFQFLGSPHIVAMLLTVIIPLAFAALVRKADSPTITRTVCYLLGATLLANEVGHWCYRLFNGEFNLLVKEYLPLHICGLAVFATAFALFCRSQTLYETAYFWGLVGTFTAIITPELEVGFPKYRFFQYFIAHSGIVIGVLFATLGLRMRPTLRSLVRSYLILNVYAVVIAGFNLLLETNYMFLCAPPDTKFPIFNPESPVFVPWPWYIPILDVLTLLLFLIVYSPFFISDWRKRPIAKG